MKTFFTILICLIISFLIIDISTVSAQYLPEIRNERGEVIPYTWPIPDSLLCIKDEVIIKFKANALHLNKLCYTYVQPMASGPNTNTITNIYSDTKSQVMAQQFPIDTLVADAGLATAIKSFGGIYLTRITSANPCTDTISITRYGDTIKSENYLWMLLKLDNNISLINACINLTLLYQYFLESAQPNFCGQLNSIPNDNYYSSTDPVDDQQWSLHPFMVDVERAWDIQTGSYDIKVGVIDNGIHYEHCDLGGEIGPGKKIAGGWNYVNPLLGIGAGSSWHGTPVTGIIGALTNRVGSSCTQNGTAGIAGGWYYSPTNNNLGCQIWGFKINHTTTNDFMNDGVTAARVIGAIRESVSEYQVVPNPDGSRDGYGVNIINCSFGYSLYPPDLQRAINYAYEQGVSVVCSRGNVKGTEDKRTPNYPASFDPNWVTSVGANDAGNPDPEFLTEPIRLSSSYFDGNMDILAPGDGGNVYTTSDVDNNYQYFDLTSAAAPHVTGAIALLRSEFLDHPTRCIPPSTIPEPEDYENMIKASALDMNFAPENEDTLYRTKIGYDHVSAWGRLKIGKIFNMLEDGYILKHYAITSGFNKSEYSDPISGGIAIITEGKRKDCIPGAYAYARQRVVSGTITLENNWIRDGSHKLYVWGTSGHTTNIDHGGFNAGKPLYLTAFTEVTNGEGGNNLVPGIYMPQTGLTVTAKTYQYELKDVNNQTFNLPSDDKIELFISVFGKPGPTSVGNDIASISSSLIYPNPATDFIEIKPSEGSDILIYNIFGVCIINLNLTLSMNGEGVRFDISNLSPGMYFIKIGNRVEKFIKI